MSKFFLTDRDKEILLFIFKSKILTLDMVQKIFFSESSKPSACRRMKKLTKQGYLTPKPIYLNSRQVAAFTVSPKAVEAVSEFLEYQVTHKYYVSDSFHHDLDLVKIDAVVSRFYAVDRIITESELQSCDGYSKDRALVPFVKLRSDRVLSVESDSGLQYVALEYERSTKSQKRNLEKLKDYYSKNRIPAIFYVCKDLNVMRALSKVDVEITKDRKSKVYFTTLSEFNNQTDKITFQRHDGHKVDFKLKPIAC